MEIFEILILLAVLVASIKSSPQRIRRWALRFLAVGLVGLVIFGTLAVAWLLISPPALEAAEARPLRDGIRLEGVVTLEEGGLTFAEKDKKLVGPKGGLTAKTINGPTYNKIDKKLIGRHFKAVASQSFQELMANNYKGEVTVQVRALTCGGVSRLLVEGWSHRADELHVSCRPATGYSQVNISGDFDGQESLTIAGEIHPLLPNEQLEKLRKKWAKKDYDGLTLRGEWIPMKEGKAFLITRLGRFKRSSS